MIVAAVPVKDLINAKQRLQPMLSPDERRELAAAMLRDVLRPLVALRLDFVWVVTGDDDVIAIARTFDRVSVLTEAENRGHTAAVAVAQALAVDVEARLFLTVPGDVPCADEDELSLLFRSAAQRQPAAVFTPSRSGLGTNGVALVPPDAMPLTFGEPSFDNHMATARRRGLNAHELRLRGLSLDVDRPEDLAALLVEGAETESGRLLARWNVGARLAATAARPEHALHRGNPDPSEASHGPVEAPSE